MKGFQILSNCNQRRSELFCEIAHKNTPIIAQKFQNLAAALLAQHQNLRKVRFRFFPLTLASFRFFHKAALIIDG